MEKQKVLEIISLSKEKGVSEKEICIQLGINPKNLYYYKKKYDLIECGRGKSINSKKKRKYNINDDFFHIPNLLNSYWAGFIAADGNISKDYKLLSFGLSKKDKIILETFINDTNSENIIREYKSNEKDCVALQITSKQFCKDLKNNFNITDNKSLTLTYPVLFDELIDSFIIGYIDGDGSIGLYDGKTQKFLRISILGTLEMCNWIKQRFSNLYGEEIGSIVHKKEHNCNTYSYSITDKSARFIFEYLNKINVPKLERKWSLEKLDHCETFQRSRKINSKYQEILELKLQGLTQTEIARQLNVTQANISWYYKQEIFKNMETKQLDAGESDIEEEN